MKLASRVLVAVALFGAVAWAQDEPKKVTKAEARAAIASMTPPDYPAVARQLKIQGAVELNVVVAESGEVVKVEIVSGNAVLTGSASQAVKRWKFKPFLEDGKAIRVLAPITLDFKL